MQPDHQLLRQIPKVDDCLKLLTTDPALANIPGRIIKKCTRTFLEKLRQDILTGQHDPTLLGDSTQLFSKLNTFILTEFKRKFRRVINGTGVIIHTNLGRSILPENTMDELHAAGAHYSNLEFDLVTGERGSRYSLVEEIICDLTGAEAALVVNNNAAAVLIVLDTLAKGREAIVSRGQLVEIGGSFRIPDVMARSGACLVEVGATNRTHLRDYEAAINEHTGLLLKVHCSNYRIIGFTKEVSNEELVALGGRAGVPVMEDLGSGCLVDLSQFGLLKEPTVQEVVASGVDVVTFSGDKLLGGPQAGIIVGCKEYIERIKMNPLNRALRIDKFTLAGLESVLRLYLDEKKAFGSIPTLAMISASVESVTGRAHAFLRFAPELEEYCTIETVDVSSRVGGGAMPEQNLPSRAVAILPKQGSLQSLESALRAQDTPVIGRVEDGRLLFDMRTIGDDEVILLYKGLIAAFKALN